MLRNHKFTTQWYLINSNCTCSQVKKHSMHKIKLICAPTSPSACRSRLPLHPCWVAASRFCQWSGLQLNAPLRAPPPVFCMAAYVFSSQEECRSPRSSLGTPSAAGRWSREASALHITGSTNSRLMINDDTPNMDGRKVQLLSIYREQAKIEKMWRNRDKVSE